MQELGDLARDGELADFIREPPRHLSARNGVEGVSFYYDPYLVDYASGSLDTGFFHRSLEFSTRLADLLALILRRSQGQSNEGESLSERVYKWWRRFSARTYGAELKPVVVEMTLGPDYPVSREPSGEEFRYYRSYRIAYRRSRGAYLHYAEPGGRAIPEDGTLKGKWGTIGGFVSDRRSGRTFAMTAQHAAQCLLVTGTPSFIPPNSVTARSAMSALSSLFSSDPKLRRESGPVSHSSPPQIVDRYKCDSACAPTNAGLDVALIELPGRAITEDLGVARLNQITPVLGLEYRGARSGRRAVEAASLSIWHSYRLREGDDRFACVGNCLQVKHEKRPYVQIDVTAGGDSGAWVIAQGEDKRFWIGSVLGGDGDRAGVAYGDEIVNLLERTDGLELRPFF